MLRHPFEHQCRLTVRGVSAGQSSSCRSRVSWEAAAAAAAGVETPGARETLELGGTSG